MYADREREREREKETETEREREQKNKERERERERKKKTLMCNQYCKNINKRSDIISVPPGLLVAIFAYTLTKALVGAAHVPER